METNLQRRRKGPETEAGDFAGIDQMIQAERAAHALLDQNRGIEDEVVGCYDIHLLQAVSQPIEKRMPLLLLTGYHKWDMIQILTLNHGIRAERMILPHEKSPRILAGQITEIELMNRSITNENSEIEKSFIQPFPDVIRVAAEYVKVNSRMLAL